MTARGKFVFTILLLAVVGFGAWKWWDKIAPKHPFSPPTASQPARSTPGTAGETTQAPPPAASENLAASLAETLYEVPKLAAPAVYQPKDNTIDLELSEYAGYSGIIVANGGLEPSENSIFFKKYGFKVKITLSEEESWSALNSAKIGAAATTVDVLAVYGRQFNAFVPVQIGFSRGADGVVVRKNIKRINDLKGKILATCQFTEADFFIRYLAQEANIGVKMLPDLKAQPDRDKLNLVFTPEAFAAGDLFLRDLTEGQNKLAGCVTWAPKTTEVADKSQGKAQILTTSANLLIIADILVVNKGFAQQNPDKIAGLVGGILEGNRMVRENQSAWVGLIGRAFKWDREKTEAELARIHFSNLPENLAFFSGAIDAAGSYGGIYQSTLLAYGNELVKDPADSERFLDIKALKDLEKSGEYKDQKISIAPIRTRTQGSVEGNPLLSKDIRFLFAPNSSTLETNNTANIKNLEAIKQLLQVSPGSTVLLRGHVDNALVDEFRRQGGESFVRQMALKAMELSRNRAAEIKRLLVERYGWDAKRIETVGRGWEEPAGSDNEQNRRVEVQWFTVE